MTQLVPLLNVEDVARSIAFYEAVLGARVESQWQHEGAVRWARVAFEGGQLMLNAPDQVSSAERLRRPEFAVRDPDGYAVRFSSPRSDD